MRKIIMMLILLLTWTMASAQSGLPKNLSLGARLDVGLMGILSDAEIDVYPSNGGLGGTLSFNVAYRLAGNFYVHSGLGLDYRNYFVFFEQDYYCDCMFEDEETGEMYVPAGYTKTSSEMYQQFFLEIPILAQWRIPGIIFAEAGVVLDLMLADVYSSDYSWEVDGDTFNNLYGVSLAAGIGHAFDSGLFLDLRVTYQLTDLINSSKLIHNYADEWNDGDNDGYEELLETVGSYHNLLKIRLGVGYWF